MKTIIKSILIVFIITFISCEKESDLVSEMSHEDEEAAEEMEEALEMAEAYNDSLIWCVDTNNSCSVSFISYCDSMFHSHSDEYELHHAIYSHNNTSDDHHHSATSQHHHGNGGGHSETGGGGHGGGENHGHNIESHEHMAELRALHPDYHPK